jgi:hypothetical protein
MTTITTPAPSSSTTSTTSGTSARGTRSGSGRWRVGLAIAAGAAVANLAVVAIAHAAGVSFEIEGEMIPLAAFAQMTFLFSVVGIVLASAFARWARKPQRTFVVTTVVLTALSFAPDLTAHTDTATRLTLMATHLIAAALVIPVLARRVPTSR